MTDTPRTPQVGKKQPIYADVEVEGTRQCMTFDQLAKAKLLPPKIDQPIVAGAHVYFHGEGCGIVLAVENDGSCAVRWDSRRLSWISSNHLTRLSGEHEEGEK